MSSTTPNLGLTKTTAAETIGQNWAASNDSGGNFDIIDTKMGAVGNTSLQAQVTALSSQLANGIVKCGSKTITIPAWSTGNPQSITVDFTDDIPTGRSIYCVLGSIGPTQLPYINNSGVVKTWIRNLTDNDKKVVIYSTDGDGWSNKTFYYALVLK